MNLRFLCLFCESVCCSLEKFTPLVADKYQFYILGSRDQKIKYSLVLDERIIHLHPKPQICTSNLYKCGSRGHKYATNPVLF